jgi:hypothetical protein
MPHLIQPFSDETLLCVHAALVDAHGFLVAQCCHAIQQIERPHPTWGIQTKRLNVNLDSPHRPQTIGKPCERLAEVVNMLATLERLIAGLAWFRQQPEFANAVAIQCHPTTSSSKYGNDLVLGDKTGRIVARCEVCDIVSGIASQNNKHRKDLRSLQCNPAVPMDGVRRFVCTSPEFAKAIMQSPRFNAVCRYDLHRIENACGTVMLEICPPVCAMAKGERG